jgi:hypothetical protein
MCCFFESLVVSQAESNNEDEINESKNDKDDEMI